MTEQYANILVERRGRVGLVTLNRPEALNALNKATMDELVAAVTAMDTDPEVGAVVVTGSAKAFAAGADIKEMQSKGYMDMYAADWFRGWEDFTRLRIPVVAAVSGFALGGGCELAMMCDFIIAGDNAKFGQPEINLGVLPGMGGSQRLTRAVGKSKAMDMILTGRFMDAEEAERAGPGVPRGPGRRRRRGGAEGRRGDRLQVQAGGDGGQGSGQRGLRDRAGPGRAV